jgi:hypothetical protein
MRLPESLPASQSTVCSADGGGGGPVSRNRFQRVSAARALGAKTSL